MTTDSDQTPVTDSEVGQDWAIRYIHVPNMFRGNAEFAERFPHECAILATADPVYLSPLTARRIAFVLNTYADRYEKELKKDEPGTLQNRDGPGG